MTGSTVLVVSADMLFADAIAAFLATAGWSVVGAVGDGVRALSLVGRSSPDRVVLLGHPERLRAEALVRQLVRRVPAPGIVMLASDNDAPPGALPRSSSAAELLAALHTPPPLSVGDGPSSEGIGLLATLTPRERTVLGLLAQGRTRGEIAEALEVTPNTVRTHTQHLFAKLRIHTAGDLIRFAVRQGLVGSEATPDARWTRARPR